MPKLWTDTIEGHRLEVRDAILETTAALVAERGVRAVTMREIAERTGIGRATLYKYFPDVEAILHAWHERHVAAHLERLGAMRSAPGRALDRLREVLAAYATIQLQSHATELAAVLHRGEHVAHAHRHLLELVRDLVAESASAGDVRDDVAPDELARFCIHALGAASELRSKAALERLVDVTLSGLAPRRRRR